MISPFFYRRPHSAVRDWGQSTAPSRLIAGRASILTMYYVYILESEKTARWYVGMSKDPEKRLREEHNVGNVRSTKGGRPYKIVYREEYKTKTEALRRERQIKNSGAIRKGIKRQLTHTAPSSIGYPADRQSRATPVAGPGTRLGKSCRAAGGRLPYYVLCIHS
jgi:putative endonuclease